MGTTPILNDDLVNQQPDVNSGGSTFSDALETSALADLSALATGAVTQIAPNGRMPMNAQSPNFGSINGTTTQQSPLGSSGLVLLIIVLVLVF